MASDWQIVAFPLILPWRGDFWTLPLYFPNLKVGVIPGWPVQLPYQGLPLPREATDRSHELKGYKPGDLRQWQAFEKYQEDQAEGPDLLGTLRNYGQAKAPAQEVFPEAWALAWQIEKLQADQEAQLMLVDQGQDWLKDILAPEPWEERPGFGSAPGAPELVAPDLARLRYTLWQQVLAPHLQDLWAPLLLGRTSRSLFLSLRGWPELVGPQRVQFSLPGCHSVEEWRQVCGGGEAPPWQEQAVGLLGNLLDEADDLKDLEKAAAELNEFVADEVVPQWPYPVIWNFDMEVWVQAAEDQASVLCWTEAGAGILPG